jgi:hypothetical protein
MVRDKNMAELVQQARQGSQDAFNELYHLTRDRAYFVAFFHCQKRGGRP